MTTKAPTFVYMIKSGNKLVLGDKHGDTYGDAPNDLRGIAKLEKIASQLGLTIISKGYRPMQNNPKHNLMTTIIKCQCEQSKCHGDEMCLARSLTWVSTDYGQYAMCDKCCYALPLEYHKQSCVCRKCKISKNPKQGALIYGRIMEIRAQKTSGPYKGKFFKHVFKNSAMAIGLANGDVLITSRRKG